jgi:hypothetical protein
MLQAGAEPDFAEEAIGAQDLGQVGMDDLECDGPVVPEIVGQEDPGHAAAAQLTVDPETVGQGRLQAIQRIGQADSVNS